MKKTAFIMLVAFLCAGVTMAQKTASKKMAAPKVSAPDVVAASLKEKVTGDYSPVWTKSAAGNFVASFENNGTKQHAEFTPEGKWISTNSIISFEQLSETAQTKLKEQYGEMQVAEVKKIEREGIAAFYKVKLMKDKDSKIIYINDAGFINE
jgi:hypothetical protein